MKQKAPVERKREFFAPFLELLLTYPSFLPIKLLENL